MRFALKLLFIVVISAGLAGCASPYKVYRIEGGSLPKTDNIPAVKLRRDGLYSVYDTSVLQNGERVNEHYKVNKLLNIVNDSLIHCENFSGYTDYRALSLNHYKSYRVDYRDGLGRYIIKNDTIFAKTIIILKGAGGTQNLHEAYFQGIVKNKNTITNWKMVRPYPNANLRWNYDNFKHLTKPHTFYFIESHELLGLDSLLHNEQVKVLEK